MSHEPDASDSPVPKEPHPPAVMYPSTWAESFVYSGFGVSSAPLGHITQCPWGCFDLCVTACLAQALLKLLSVGAVRSRGAGVHGEPNVGLLDVGAFFLGNFVTPSGYIFPYHQLFEYANSYIGNVREG